MVGFGGIWSDIRPRTTQIREKEAVDPLKCLDWWIWIPGFRGETPRGGTGLLESWFFFAGLAFIRLDWGKLVGVMGHERPQTIGPQVRRSHGPVARSSAVPFRVVATITMKV